MKELTMCWFLTLTLTSKSMEVFPIKQLYLIRHCKAEGQPPEAPLTPEGNEQAKALAEFLSQFEIQQIYSSPYLRAYKSIEPLAALINLQVTIDERLSERILSKHQYPDWLDRLKTTFEDLDLCWEGGESSRSAMDRGVSALTDILKRAETSAAVVTHGNLMTLLLKHFDNERFGFNEWKSLSNPDVYQVTINDDKTSVERTWQ